MSTSQKAAELLAIASKDADLAQYYMWFINLLTRAANGALSEEQKATLNSELPKFKGGPLCADAQIDALLATFRVE